MYRLIYPGSFNPLTIGHLDLIERSVNLCDELVVAVVSSGSKNFDLSLEQRQRLVEAAMAGQTFRHKVRVVSYPGLLADLFHELDAQAVVRGLRHTVDYEYEVPMTEINRQLNPDYETIFLQAKPELAHVSSSLIREMWRLGQDFRHWLPAGSYELLMDFLEQTEAK